MLPVSSELAPHGAFIAALLRFDDLRRANAPDASEARNLAAQFESSSQALERAGYGEVSFLARLAAAQTLDAAGLDGEALEKWIAIGQSKQFQSADESVQVAVAGRIQSYRDRLRAEMAARIRSEEQDKAHAQVQEIEARCAQLSDEQRARIAALESELEKIGARKDAEALSSLALQRAAFEGTADQQAQRIRELEQLLVDIAVAADRDWHGKDQALLAQSGVAVTMSTDVVSLWQAARLRSGSVLVE